MSVRIKTVTAEKYLSLLKQKTPSLVTLDVTWYPAGKDGHQEYVTEHIAGARYFDFNEVKTESPYPHMLPRSAAEFAKHVSKLGLRRSDYVVVYDQASYLSAPRVAWLLATFNHPNVFLLDNYQKYKQLGGPVESGESPAVEPTEYASAEEIEHIAKNTGKWLEYEDILKIAEAGEVPSRYNLIDARGAARFHGTQAEPRPGIQSGHIPGSQNIPFTDVVGSDGSFKSKAELEQIFAEKGIDSEKPTIVLCGSGVTACVVKAAIDDAFGTSADIYDGSWSEWGQRAPSKLVVKS